MAIFGEPMASRYVWWLLQGFGLTLILSVCVCMAGSVLGTFLCAMKISAQRHYRLPARLIISALRNTPLLVQLFFWYFGMTALLPSSIMNWLNTPHRLALAGMELRFPSFEVLAGFWALTLYASVYIAEELRAGIRRVDERQGETAAALGLRPSQIFRLVILPQAVRIAWLPILGQYLNTIKNSSLTMAIGVAELSYASRQVETETFLTFQAFGIATLLYVGAVVTVETLGQRFAPGSRPKRTRAWRLSA